MTPRRPHARAHATPGGWIRRRPLPLLARVAAGLGLALLAVYLTGRIMTDRTPWSQYLWWVPALWLILPAWACWLVSAVAGRLALRPGGIMLRPILLIACLAATLWMLFAGWHAHRYIAPPPSPPRDQTLRLLHWNHASRDDMAGSGDLIRTIDPDIAVIFNTRNDANRREVVHTLFETLVPPGDATIRVLPAIEAENRTTGHIFGTWRAVIASRTPILRAGTVNLQAIANADPDWNHGIDHGVIIWCEIEPGPRFAHLGRPIVIWAIDFPSDPGLHRAAVMDEAARAVAAWNQPPMTVTPGGWWRPFGEPTQVPPPDVVLGDFNTPRESASLDRFVPDTRDAFEAAGRGRARSWRQARAAGPGGPILDKAVARLTKALLPLADWHIDLTRVSDPWRTARYQLVRPPTGPHDAQVADLVLDPKPDNP